MISILGICILLAIAFAASNNRKLISKRTVSTAFLLQFFIAAFALYIPAGQNI